SQTRNCFDSRSEEKEIGWRQQYNAAADTAESSSEKRCVRARGAQREIVRERSGASARARQESRQESRRRSARRIQRELAVSSDDVASGARTCARRISGSLRRRAIVGARGAELPRRSLRSDPG